MDAKTREALQKLEDMKKERAGIHAQMKAIYTQADSEARALTEEETSQWEDLRAQGESLSDDIGRREMLVRQGESWVYDPQAAEKMDPRIGMDKKEVSRFSFIKAIRALDAARKGEPDAWKDAGLELAASRAVAEKLGREPEGLFIPYDVQERDLVVGTTTAGGYLKETELRPGSFIELLRNKMMVRQAGATILGGLVGDIAIPSQTAGGTFYWVAESGAPTESQQTLGQVQMSPKTGGAFTDISRKLLKQSSVDVEDFVINDLAAITAIGIDLAALHGTGTSNQPTGIAATSGIGSVAGGTNGAAPDWADLVDLETEVAVDNADVGRLAYMTNTKVRGKLKKTLITATYGDQMVWPINANELNGYPAWVTNQVSSALTKGSSSGVCSAIFFGNWADLFLAMWGGLDILVDPYTGSSSGTLRVVVLQDVDVAVRHAVSFAAMLDALTT